MNSKLASSVTVFSVNILSSVKRLMSKRLMRGPLPAAIASTGLLLTSFVLTALPSYSLEFPPSGDRGAPARTGSGGVRGDRCALPSGQRMSALMPLNNVSTFTGEQASLWVHVPAELSEKSAEIFVSNPQTHEVVYQQPLQLPQMTAAGIVKFNLPATKADGTSLLLPNQDYFWEVATICDASDRSRDQVVQGFMHRLETEAISPDDLSKLSRSQQAEQYAAAEIWQQTVDIASTLKTAEMGLWSQLLASVGLETLANEAVIEGPVMAAP
jgi:hypothetical protein